MVKVEVIEEAGKFVALVKVTENDGSVRECWMPKVILDVVKNDLPTMNLTQILARSSNNTYNLS